MKNFICILLIIICYYQGYSQKYGVLFVHGLDDDNTLFKTYDYNSLVSELKNNLGQDTEFKHFGFIPGTSISEAANNINSQWLPDDKTRNWFIVGHSMGGLVGRYYLKYYNAGSGVNVKGLITMNSPHAGVSTIAAGRDATMEKWQNYNNALRSYPDGDNPWFAQDIFSVSASFILGGPVIGLISLYPIGAFEVNTYTAKQYYNTIRDAVKPKLEKHFENLSARKDILSLQKGSSDLTKLNSGSDPFKMRVIAAEELNLSVLRATGGKPDYIDKKYANETISIGGLDLISFNQLDIAGALMGQPGFNNNFEAGPFHAVSCWLAVREFHSGRADAYLTSENCYHAAWVASKIFTFGFGIGELRYQRNRAAAAKERYRESRRQADRLDWVSQDIVNDLKTITTTRTITAIEDEWLEECGAEYYGWNDPGRPDMVPKSLPSILPRGICDEPDYFDYTVTYYSYEARANDGVVSVANQTPPAGSGSFYLAPKTPYEGYSHFSSLWNYRPWSGQETATMRQAKQYIRDNKN